MWEKDDMDQYIMRRRRYLRNIIAKMVLGL
jgi:hypothetical protein